jgi:hypothetical protein
VSARAAGDSVSAYLLQEPKPRPTFLTGDTIGSDEDGYFIVASVAWTEDGWVYRIEPLVIQ